MSRSVSSAVTIFVGSCVSLIFRSPLGSEFASTCGTTRNEHFFLSHTTPRGMREQIRKLFEEWTWIMDYDGVENIQLSRRITKYSVICIILFYYTTKISLVRLPLPLPRFRPLRWVSKLVKFIIVRARYWEGCSPRLRARTLNHALSSLFCPRVVVSTNVNPLLPENDVLDNRYTAIQCILGEKEKSPSRDLCKF